MVVLNKLLTSEYSVALNQPVCIEYSPLRTTHTNTHFYLFIYLFTYLFIYLFIYLSVDHKVSVHLMVTVKKHEKI
jgi:hypothetical protein